MSVKKQAVSLLTGLAMLLTLLMLQPVSVSASNGSPSWLFVDEYVLVDNGTPDNQYFVWENEDWEPVDSKPADGSSYFHYEDGVLTLSCVEIEGKETNPMGAGIFVEGGSLEIVSIGTNLVTGVQSEDGDLSAAIGVSDDAGVVFTGEGILTATAAKDRTSSGIHAYDITMESGTVTAIAEGTVESLGIRVRGTLTVKGGTLKAIAAEANSESLGIDVSGRWDDRGNLLDAGDMVVSGGTVTAYGGNASNESCGIKTTGDFTVSGGMVTANGAEVNGSDDYPRSCGIVSDGTLTVENGSVTANAGENSTHESYGVVASNVNVSGGTLDATGYKADVASFGIAVDGDMEVSGSGQVTAIAGEADEVSKGVEIRWHTNENWEPVTPGKLTVSGGMLTATGGSGNHNESYGLIAPAVTVTGGTINATGKDAATASFGIATDGDLEISGGKVVAKAGQASEVTKGVDVRNYQGENGEQFGKLIVSGGILDATGGTATGDPGDSYGVYAPVVTVSAGTVYATGVESANASYGIATVGDLVVTGSGNVIAQAGTAGCDSQAIDVRWYEVGDQQGNPGKLEVSGGALTANGGQAGVTSCGVKANGEFVVSNGTLTATGGLSGNVSCGVVTDGALAVENGTVTATGGLSGYVSCGVVAPDMQVSGGNVIAEGGGTAENPAEASLGIVSESLAVSGGNVQATTGDATNTSMGISSSFVNVSVNGIVSVTAGNGKEFSVGIGVAGFQISDNALVISKAGVGQESCGILSDNATMNNGTFITDTIGISRFSGDKETNCLAYGQDSYLQGNVVLPVDIEIPEGVEILIEEGNSLTVSKGVTLTNNGSINGTGIIYNNGTIKTGENGSYTVKIVVPEVPQKEYTIYFDGNGGNVSVSSMTTTGGKLVSMPYATRYGYTFTGWYTADGSLVSTDTIFTGNTTLYAGWKLNEIYVPVEPEVPDYTPVKPSQPSEPETEWRREDGNIYYYKDGKMVKGWVEEDGVWYWMDEETGAMTTEDWVKVDNVWYAFDDAGKMLTGWQEIDGEWYYLKDWGGMATGWQFIDNNWYYFRGNGTMVASAWVETNGQWYFLTGSGAMALDKWIEWKGEWYFLYSSGMMATNATIDGYYVDSNGIWQA